MQIKQSIDPLTETEELFVEFKNTSVIALVHGDVLIRDMTQTAGNCFCTTTTAAHSRVEGVVFDPSGAGVAVGATGICMKKGFGKVAILSTAATALSAGVPLTSHTTSAEATAFVTTITTLYSSGMTVANAKLYGHPGIFAYVAEETTAAATTIDAYIDSPVVP